MKTARSFKEFLDATFKNVEDQVSAHKISQEYFDDFVNYTPIELELLESYLAAGHLDLFYLSLADLKYLIEFSDNFNRYWHLLRGYSGALFKLKDNQTVKGSKKIYSYYYGRYGDRRMLRNEHWFEKKRWEFLDELQVIYTEEELAVFMYKYQQILSENLEIYLSFMKVFVNDLKNLLKATAPLQKNKA